MKGFVDRLMKGMLRKIKRALQHMFRAVTKSKGAAELAQLRGSPLRLYVQNTL